MKNKILILLLTLTNIGLIFANSPQKTCAKRDAMRAQKIAFITEKMALTPEEAQNFWPLYNAYQEDSRKIRHQIKEIETSTKDNWKESDYKKAADQLIDLESQQTALKLRYHQEYLKVISAKKLFSYYSAENEYKKQLIRSIEQSKK